MSTPVQVIIVGAGPAGLLLAHYLLKHGNAKFQVVIYEKGEDPRTVHSRGPSTRRYSMGLCKRGVLSIDAIPGLLTEVKEVLLECSQMVTNVIGIVVKKAVSEKEFKPNMVDRIALCAKLLDHLVAAHGNSGLLEIHFGQACTAVSLSRRVATFAPIDQVISEGASICAPGSKESGTNSQSGPPADQKAKDVQYDLLVGADGVRSSVRMAMMQQSRNFQVEMKDIFQEWTVTHFPPPTTYRPNSFFIIPKVPKSPELQAIGMPISPTVMCFLWGWAMSNPPKNLDSVSTPEEAEAFVNARLPYLQMPKSAAWELLKQPKKSSMQVKCWRYHDTEGQCVLIGDAAHATSPALGQGCNASLVDAAVLGRLLIGQDVNETNRIPESVPPPASLDADQLKERLPLVLSTFTSLQVKEGHALVDMSWSGSALNRTIEAIKAFCFLLRAIISGALPWLVGPPLVTLCSSTTMPYHKIKQKFAWSVAFVGAWNTFIRNSYFEKQCQTGFASKED